MMLSTTRVQRIRGLALLRREEFAGLDSKCLELELTAEGVERLEELSFLREHHCDEAQGFYLSRAVLAADFAQLLETGIVAALREDDGVERPSA